MIPTIIVRILQVLAVLAALWIGVLYLEGRGYDRRAAEDKAQMESIKRDAAEKLATETQAKLDAQVQLAHLIAKTEKERELLQNQNRAALRDHADGPRLQFIAETGREAGGGGAAGPALGASLDAGAAPIQLPDQISRNLWQFAADAESIKIDYEALYYYVHNPRLLCELRE